MPHVQAIGDEPYPTQRKPFEWATEDGRAKEDSGQTEAEADGKTDFVQPVIKGKAKGMGDDNAIQKRPTMVIPLIKMPDRHEQKDQYSPSPQPMVQAA